MAPASPSPPLLTRYEFARVVGMRALQLDEGDEPRVRAPTERLRGDSVYVAALELYEGRLDAMVRRDGAPAEAFHVARACLPPEVAVLLDNRDGGARRARGGALAPPATARAP